MKRILSLLIAAMLVLTSVASGMVGVFATEAETYNEIPNDAFWGKIAHSQTNASNVHSLFDGTQSSAWNPGYKQGKGSWFAFDLGAEVNVNAIKLDEALNSDGSAIAGTSAPTSYDLYYATDGTDYNNLRGITWTGNYKYDTTIDPDFSKWTKLGTYSASELATFETTSLRYLLVDVLENADVNIAIGEFRAYSPEVIESVDYTQEDGYISDKAFWSTKAWTTPGVTSDNKAEMTDGDLTNSYSLSANASDFLPYVIVDMGYEVNLNRVVMKWPYPNMNYMPETVDIYTAVDAEAFDEGKDSSAWKLAADDVWVNASYFDARFQKRTARYFMIKVAGFGLNYLYRDRDWIDFGEIYAFEDEDMTLYYDVPKADFWGKIAHSQTDASNVQSLFDGTKSNAWNPGYTQSEQAWIAVDLGKEVKLNAIRLDEALNSDGSAIEGVSTPTAYDLYYATDGADYNNLRGITWVGSNIYETTIDPDLSKWTKLGSYNGNEQATFKSKTVRYLLIDVTENADSKLAVGEFNAFSPSVVKAVDYTKEENFIDKSFWTVNAWWGVGFENKPHRNVIIDGNVNTMYEDEANSSDKLPFVAIDMGGSYDLSRVVMEWNCSNKNYMPETVDIYTSNSEAAYADKDSADWKLAAENVDVKASYIDSTFNPTEARYFMIKAKDLGFSYSGQPKSWIVVGEVYAYGTEVADPNFFEIPNNFFWAKAKRSVNGQLNISALFDGRLGYDENYTEKGYWQYARDNAAYYQNTDQWIAFDLGNVHKLKGIYLEDSAYNTNTPPTGYNLYVSKDGTDYNKLVGDPGAFSGNASGEAVGPTVEDWTFVGDYATGANGSMAKFDEIEARYVLVVPNEMSTNFVTIDEFHAYSSEEVTYDFTTDALDSSAWMVKSWANGNSIPFNTAVWDAACPAGNMPWMMVDMGTNVTIDRIAHVGYSPCEWYAPKKVNIYTATDAAAYEDINSDKWTLAAANVELNSSMMDAKFDAKTARYFMIMPTELPKHYSGNTSDWMGYYKIYAYEAEDPNFFEIPNNFFWAKAKRSVNGQLNITALFDGRLGYDENHTEKGYWQYGRDNEAYYQNTDQWIAFDLGNEHKLKGIYLEDSAYNPNTPPTRYNLYVSKNGTDYNKLVGDPGANSGNASGEAVGPTVENWTFVGNFMTNASGSMAKFGEIDARYVLVVPSEAAANFMTIDEFHAYSSEEVTYDFTTDALDSSAWMVKSWANGNSIPFSTATWDAACPAGSMPWMMVDMGTNVTIDRIAHVGYSPCEWYAPKKVNIYTATDAAAYEEINSDKWTLAAANVELNSSMMDAKFDAKTARYFMIMPTELPKHYSGNTSDWMGYYKIYAYEATTALKVNELAFCDSNNEVTTVVGNVTSVKAAVVLDTDAADYDAEKPYTAVLIAAQYNGGRLVKTNASQPVTLVDGNNDIDFEITIDSQTTECKLFLFNSLSSFVPYVENVSIGK